MLHSWWGNILLVTFPLNEHVTRRNNITLDLNCKILVSLTFLTTFRCDISTLMGADKMIWWASLWQEESLKISSDRARHVLTAFNFSPKIVHGMTLQVFPLDKEQEKRLVFLLFWQRTEASQESKDHLWQMSGTENFCYHH